MPLTELLTESKKLDMIKCIRQDELFSRVCSCVSDSYAVRGYLSNKSGLTPESNLANQDILIMHKLGGVSPASDKYRLTQN